ncbi:M48 family metallopeptidase [Methylophaga nitratireducenticrescens]|uniref:M48 family metallopeptidase n=1 Tax=Methylophaga nitratireducenticrescens TaxID=754476 RepID=UPI000B79C4BB|nr:M48 family metallopeptidase [Methylophaga nitratireducenticrescens]AFI84608.2 hypothetical protein Q7A_1790 [Methylophaga nitratireducenticrescens]AUZ84623.1 hypothetical protein CDW43_08545 [Methylophaga nitratireducenticrescens]
MSIRIVIPIFFVLFSTSTSAGFLDGVKNFGGTVADTGKNVFNKTKSVVGVGDVVDTLEYPFIQSLEIDAQEHNITQQENYSYVDALKQDVLMSRRAGESIEPLENVNIYLNKIAAKLLISWKGYEVNTSIYVVSAEGYTAVARSNGGIFIPIETLNLIESEDELAALIAHEISHVILKHHVVDNLDITLDKTMQYAQIGLALKGGFNQDNISKDLLNFQIANFLITDAFFPKWNRGQENEADLLGTDLLLNAGYSLNGMMSVLKKLAAYENEKEEIIFANYAKSEGEGMNASFSLDIGGLVEQSANKLQDSLAKRHQDTDKRLNRLNNYVKKFYRDRQRPDISTERYIMMVKKDKQFIEHIEGFQASKTARNQMTKVGTNFTEIESNAIKGVSGNNSSDSFARLAMFELRKAQGDIPTALKNLDIAMESGSASYHIYYQKYITYLQAGDFDAAINQLNLIDNEFGKEDIRLPNRIDVVRKSGNPVELMVAECLTKGNMDLFQMCQQAANGQYSPIGI